MTAQASVVYTIPKQIWLTSNDRPNRYERARLVQHHRAIGGWQARAQRVPHFERALITAWISTPTAVKFDPPNAWPTLKGLIDGLVDVGVLPDDDDLHVPETSFRRGPKTGEKGIYRIRLLLVDQIVPF